MKQNKTCTLLYKLQSILALAFALLVHPSAWAATINVPADEPTIQDAVDAALPGDTIQVAAGTYAEDLTIDKPLTLLGPNAGTAGNGVRVAEATIVPATNDAVYGVVISVGASNVTIDGFNLNGDNALLSGGVLGTNGADINAAEAVAVYSDNRNSLTVQNNIIRNVSYFGVTLYGLSFTAPVTSGHSIANNLIQDLGTYAPSLVAYYGGGVLLYNNQYASVTNNVMNNVAIGVQTGNFSLAKPGAPATIDGNTITSRYLGVFHNLNGHLATPYSISNNTITGIANVNEPYASGVLIGSMAVGSAFSNNTINMTAVDLCSGYEVWNVKSSTPATITGGSVTGATYGVFLNNFASFSLDAADGTYATISGLSITSPADGIGLRVLDSPSSTIHAPVVLTLGAGVSVTGGLKGLVVENASASVNTLPNLALTGQTGNYIELINNSNNIDAYAVLFAGKTGAMMDISEVLAVETKVLHKFDNAALGLVSWYTVPVDISNIVISTPVTFADLIIPNGVKVTVTATGSITVTGKTTVEPLGILDVIAGSLTLGDDNEVEGTFTIFNSFGSWNINGDTTFTVGKSLALISDIHVAAGKTVTVDGGGEFFLDGCVIDSQTPGSPYNLVAGTNGLLTIARCVVTDANIDINTTLTGNKKSRVFDNSFVDSVIEGSVEARVYHNLFDNTTSTVNTVIDGWANVTDAANLQNKFVLDFAAPVLSSRTQYANGDTYVQPGDDVVMNMDVSALGANYIDAAEALLGYNSDMLTLPVTSPKVEAEAGWATLIESVTTPVSPSILGLIDSTLVLDFSAPPSGTNAAGTIAKVNFVAGNPGQTLGFFRVQTNGLFNPDGSFVKDTRLTKVGGSPSLLSAFTANTGTLIIDNQSPTISIPSATGTQVQASAPAPVPVLSNGNYTFRNGGQPVVFTFTATDAGLAGLDLADAANDVTFSATNGMTTLNSWTISAVEILGVPTYTVTLAVPPTATNGTYTVTGAVIDRSGNSSGSTTLGTIQIANEVLATVQLQGFVGALRDVVFTATNAGGAPLGTWTSSVSFTSGTGSVNLANVPAGTVAISAKTAWNLRSKVPAAFTPQGVSSVALTGADMLLGGDLTGDNVVNTLDFSRLRVNWFTFNAVADITGDGVVNLPDSTILTGNFYTIGDPL